MQDRYRQFDEILLLRTAGPYIGSFGAEPISLRADLCPLLVLDAAAQRMIATCPSPVPADPDMKNPGTWPGLFCSICQRRSGCSLLSPAPCKPAQAGKAGGEK
jgi:hypothetical protein